MPTDQEIQEALRVASLTRQIIDMRPRFCGDYLAAGTFYYEETSRNNEKCLVVLADAYRSEKARREAADKVAESVKLERKKYD